MMKCFSLELVESKAGEFEQGKTNNQLVVASAARTSKRLREKKDRKLLHSVAADNVEIKEEHASPGLKKHRPGRLKSICCCCVYVAFRT